MTDLITLFKAHIDNNIFDPEAKFESDGISKIRVDQPNRSSLKGFKNSRSIVLIFDKDVIEAFAQAEAQSLDGLIATYKFSLRKLILNRMTSYDADGDKGTAFQIHIDSRATDL